MKCPNCNSSDTKVIETRSTKDLSGTRRRRECEQCQWRFSTMESIIVTLPCVVKKNGLREAFSQAKILKGLKAACLKRPITPEQLQDIVKKIVYWAEQLRSEEISSKEIGIMVLQELKMLDKVASIRFASVHQTFNDVDEFLSHLETL
jgi:transcriptional repressor NrdR